MKQPKFKFIDLLKPKAQDEKGRYPVVIYIRGGEYFYSFDETEIGLREEAIELYQEPQKKKLYAYEKDALVVFAKTEKSVNPILFLGAKFKRSPEYDIEYPTKVVRNSEAGHGQV